METFYVPVLNELTQEFRIVEVLSTHGADAQVEALQRLFRLEGWRKATALIPNFVGGRELQVS